MAWAGLNGFYIGPVSENCPIWQKKVIFIYLTFLPLLTRFNSTVGSDGEMWAWKKNRSKKSFFVETSWNKMTWNSLPTSLDSASAVPRIMKSQFINRINIRQTPFALLPIVYSKKFAQKVNVRLSTRTTKTQSASSKFQPVFYHPDSSPFHNS